MMREGQFAVGDRLPPERDLAARFGVSRTTLRDAIRELELLGYLQVRQGNGTEVRRPSADTLSAPFRTLLRGAPQRASDLLQFRRLLEPEVAVLAAQHCDDTQAISLNSAMERQRRLVERGQPLVDEDLAFHRLIAHVAGNRTVLDVMDTLNSMLRELRSHMLAADQPQLAIDQHEAITGAIIAGDGEAAHAAVLVHLEAVERSAVRGPSSLPREVGDE